MSLLTKAGITKISELDIDANKDWQAKEITNLKAIVAGMAQGDVIHRGESLLERLAADYGIGLNFLHMSNAGAYKPGWRDIQDVVVYLSGAVNRIIEPPILRITKPDISVVLAEDHSGGGFTFSETLPVPAPSIGKATDTASPLSVGGGVAHDDDGVDTDETTETNSAAADDMHLLPDPGAVGDGFYFGLASLFDWVCVNIGVAGAGVWTITWKYWDGDTWEALTMKYDETSHWRTTGKKWAHWDRPVDWALKTIEALNLYWVKAECTLYDSMTTQPLGTQAWLGQY